MGAVSVRFNTDQVTAALDQLDARGTVALRRALKRTATSVRALMATEVARDIGLRVGTVRDEVRLRVSPDDVSAEISISGRRLPLIEFGARGPEPSRGRGRGVTARLGGRGRNRYPHAFIATTRSGHRGVFQRAPGASRRGPRPHRSQLPIYQLHGPSLPHVFSRYLPLGVQRAEEQLAKNLEHELQFALSQM